MENSICGNEWLDNASDVYTAANYYNGITGFPYASNDVINIENVFQVDKADLKTGPTLAQLNANDDWDSLDLDELLASAHNDIRNFSKARSKYGTNFGYNRNNNPLNIVSSNHSIELEYDSKLQENIDYLTSLLHSSKTGNNRPMQTTNSNQLFASNDMKLLSPTTSPTPTPTAIAPQEFLSQNTSQTYSSQQNTNITNNTNNINTNTNTINNHNLLSNLLNSQPNTQTELSNDNNIQLQQTSTTVISDGNNALTNENIINRVRNNSMSTEYSVSSHDEGFASQPDDSDNEDDDLSSDDESFYGDYDASDLLGASTSDDANNKWSLNMGRSRKGGERRYFWQYNVQSKGPKGTRIVSVEENGDPHVLKEISDPVFSPDCRIEGVKHSGKARRGDGNDLTPNPKKLLMIGLELKKLSKIINDLTPVAEVPITNRGKSRKEKNKLASRACRLKKKAQHEANKIKLYGLQQEHKKLMSLLLEVRKMTRKYNTEYSLQEQSSSAALEKIIKQKGPLVAIAGKTSDFVNHILDNVSAGISNGGLDKI